MKIFIILSSLFLSSALSAATTGTLILQGSVSQRLSISVTPEAGSSALDLSSSQTDLKVATINERSNSRTGYKVTITSANLGNLKRTDGADIFPYSMKYGGSAVALSGAGSTFTQSSSSSVNVNKDVTVSYAGVAAESMVEGTYADTVTFNIATN